MHANFVSHCVVLIQILCFSVIDRYRSDRLFLLYNPLLEEAVEE